MLEDAGSCSMLLKLTGFYPSFRLFQTTAALVHTLKELHLPTLSHLPRQSCIQCPVTGGTFWAAKVHFPWLKRGLHKLRKKAPYAVENVDDHPGSLSRSLACHPGDLNTNQLHGENISGDWRPMTFLYMCFRMFKAKVLFQCYNVLHNFIIWQSTVELQGNKLAQNAVQWKLKTTRN